MPDSALTEYINGQVDNARRNRRDLESKWEKNREFYLSMGGIPWKKGEAKGWRSDSFPGITHQKVIYATAIVLDTVLAGGDLPFMYKPSPWERNRARVSGPLNPDVIDRSIDDMTRLTQQQLVDCAADQMYAKNVLSAALYGWTYAKFIVHKVTRSGFTPIQPEVPGIMDWQRLPTTAQQWQKWEEQFMAPGCIYVPIWSIFRDWETDDLHECAFVDQEQLVSNWWLNQKIGKAYFIDENIRNAVTRSAATNDRASSSINNNSETQTLPPALRDVQNRVNNQNYEEYWGRVPRKIVEEFEKDLTLKTGQETMSLSDTDDGDEIEICGCTYNDYTVRYVRTDPSMRPFFQAKWEDSGDELAPRGIADNCEQMHNVLKGTFRAIEDNEKLSANVIIAIKERYLKNVPEDIKPGLKLLLTEDCDDARKAIQSVVIPSVTGPLMQLLGVVRQFLDDDSMVPKIAQGVREPGDQTAREAAMRQAAASKYMGMAIRNLDNGLIEPIVTEFYKYNMNDPELPVGKGNYLVQALGFTSFMNKTDRLNALNQMITLALSNPKLEAETKIRFYWEEITKALDMDPDQGLKTEQEKQADAKNATENPAVQLELAQGKAEVTKTEAEAFRNKTEGVKNLADAKETTDGSKAVKDRAQAVDHMASAKQKISLSNQAEPSGAEQPTEEAQNGLDQAVVGGGAGPDIGAG